MQRALGQHIVVDPEICHGKPVFAGTRILVSDVLEELARGWTIDQISANWDGRVGREAIAEAIRLASESWIEHARAGG